MDQTSAQPDPKAKDEARTGHRRRTRWSRAVALVLACLGVWLTGFLIFAAQLTREKPVLTRAADGIVVLTGGADRLDAAMGLLSRGQGERLLISGVHAATTREDLRRLLSDPTGALDNRVDIGHEARNTPGNAWETALWAERHGYRSLIVVTASYHMPRSMAEMRAALPDTELIPYPVVSTQVPLDRWWRYPGTARLLAAEYTKYLLSVIRLTFKTLFG